MSSLPPPLPPAAPPPLPDDAPRKKPRGCLFWLGVTTIVLVVVLGVGGYFAVRWGLDAIAETLETYSDPTPMALPGSDMGADEYRQLAARVDAFAEGGDTLALTADEVNALIDRHPAWAMLRERLHVSMAGDTITALVAFPLDEVTRGMWRMSRLEGRFLNATVALQARFANGRMSVALRDLRVEGRELPQEFRAALRDQDVVERVMDSHSNELAERIEAFHVEDGRLVVRRRMR